MFSSSWSLSSGSTIFTLSYEASTTSVTSIVSFKHLMPIQRPEYLLRDLEERKQIIAMAQQLQQQRILDAQQEANRLQAFEPQTRLDTYGRGIAQLISGYPGSSTVTQTPNLSRLETALGVASTIGGLFGKKN